MRFCQWFGVPVTRERATRTNPIVVNYEGCLSGYQLLNLTMLPPAQGTDNDSGGEGGTLEAQRGLVKNPF